MSDESETSPGADDYENVYPARNKVRILKMYVGLQGDHSF